jgi:hypothetical protein
MAEYDSGDGRWFIKKTDLPTLNFHQFEPHIHFSKADDYSNYGRNTHHIGLSTHDLDNPDSKEVAHLAWHSGTGEVLSIRTNNKYRRLGIANTLFHEAKKAAREQGLVEPKHSDDRSDMGDAWAKQTGDPVPTRYRLPKNNE